MAAIQGATHTRMSHRLGAWLGHHREVAMKSLGELLSAWISSLMTWLVIGVALALPTLLYLIVMTVGDVSGDWDGRPRVSVYLKDEITAVAGQQLRDRLAAREDVTAATYVGADEALAEFQQHSGFGDVLDSLDSNPLPALVEVIPVRSEAGAVRLLVAALTAEAGVDRVVVDLEWIARLDSIVTLGERLVIALSSFLALGVLLSIGNTIRLAIENRRAEIEVVKLVGGTDGFVRRPFLYLGLWYGLGGALIAWLLIQASLLFLAGPAGRLLRSYGEQFVVTGLDPGVSMALLASGAGLGVLGAALAVRRHLHLIEPQ